MMLQALLKERLNLRARHEMRERPLYGLVVAKGGVRMKPAVVSASVDEPKGGRFRKSFEMSRDTGERSCRLLGKVTVDDIINQVSRELSRPLLNMTGLDGEYEIDFRWVMAPPAGFGGSEQTGAPNGGVPLASTPSGGLELFAALEKQLGLHVNTRNDRVEMIVVDHVDQIPTEN